jgi:cystathionine gamma-synthase
LLADTSFQPASTLTLLLLAYTALATLLLANLLLGATGNRSGRRVSKQARQKGVLQRARIIHAIDAQLAASAAGFAPYLALYSKAETGGGGHMLEVREVEEEGVCKAEVPTYESDLDHDVSNDPLPLSPTEDEFQGRSTLPASSPIKIWQRTLSKGSLASMASHSSLTSSAVPPEVEHENINPSGSYGVAGDSLRRLMNSFDALPSQETSQERLRYLRSLYAHAGVPTASSQETMPLATPLILATTFNIRSSGGYSQSDYFYSRVSNPTRHALENCLAAAESGPGVTPPLSAAAFGSGMAACSAAIGAACNFARGLHSQGVHVVLPTKCYDEVVKLIKMGSIGVTSFVRVNMTDLESVRQALDQYPGRGKVLYLESLSNPYVELADLTALVEIARGFDAATIVDTTWTPPLVQQSFRFGIDVVCYSCSKTMGGHSDVLAGAVVCNGDTAFGLAIEPLVRDFQITHGGVASPFDCWLILRGLRTMALRLERMCSTSVKIGTLLDAHPFVEWCRYPSLPSHPQYELAKRQMDLCGQMITFKIRGGSNAAMAFVGAVSLARRATSTGATETLVQHQRSVEMEKVTAGGIIRVSIGIEDAEDLLDDFNKALFVAQEVSKENGPSSSPEGSGSDDDIEFDISASLSCNHIEVVHVPQPVLHVEDGGILETRKHLGTPTQPSLLRHQLEKTLRESRLGGSMTTLSRSIPKKNDRAQNAQT